MKASNTPVNPSAGPVTDLAVRNQTHKERTLTARSAPVHRRGLLAIR